MPQDEKSEDRKDAEENRTDLQKASMSGPPANLESDPFEHLHKMSTTAGLGSGDYVAINGTAIAAILLGVGSAVVLFNSPVLLAVPIAGIICAIFAFRQVAGSNGTQTGREVALVGLLLSLGFGGFHLGKTAYAAYYNQADQREILGIIHQLGKDIRDEKYASAYSMFGDHIKSHVPQPIFEATLAHVSNRPILGQLESMDWNKLLIFDTDPVTDNRIATGMVLLKYTNAAEPLRISMSFRKIEGAWLIDQMPQLFPDDTPASGQQPQKKRQTAPSFGPLGPAKPAR